MNDYNELFSLAPLGFPMYSITKKEIFGLVTN